jgi:hypothetical protein
MTEKKRTRNTTINRRPVNGYPYSILRKREEVLAQIEGYGCTKRRSLHDEFCRIRDGLAVALKK